MSEISLNILYRRYSEKRTFPIYITTRPSFFLHGSITLEAALVFPIMLFFMAVTLMPLIVMDEQRKLQNGMESIAKDMTQLAYVSEVSSEFLNDDPENDLTELLGVGYATIGITSLISDLDDSIITNIRIYETEADDDDENAGSDMVYYKLEYEPVYPLGILKLDSYMLSSVTNRRKWIGSDGGRGRSKYGQGSSEDGYELDDDGDEIVYVGKNSTRYHKDRHCHYLDNVMYPVSGAEIESMRNDSGARYHACPSCDAKPEGTVYIFENGTAYHSSESCKAIASYARACKLSEVEHLGPCSYCSK